MIKDWVILILNKASYLDMVIVENDLDIYYAVGNANSQRLENEIAAIMKSVILQYGSWSPKTTAIVDTKN